MCIVCCLNRLYKRDKAKISSFVHSTCCVSLVQRPPEFTDLSMYDHLWMASTMDNAAQIRRWLHPHRSCAEIPRANSNHDHATACMHGENVEKEYTEQLKGPEAVHKRVMHLNSIYDVISHSHLVGSILLPRWKRVGQECRLQLILVRVLPEIAGLRR